MKSEWRRVDTDCVLAKQNPVFNGFAKCDALNCDAFEQYTLRGLCGTDGCPFYKSENEYHEVKVIYEGKEIRGFEKNE